MPNAIVPSENAPPGILLWAARTAWRARVPALIALVVSVGLHTAFPVAFSVSIDQTDAVSLIEIITAPPPPPMPLPEDKKVIEAPPDEQIGNPKKGKPDEPAGGGAPKKAPPKKAPPKPKPKRSTDRPNAIKTKPNETTETLLERIARRKAEREAKLAAKNGTGRGRGNGTGNGGQGGTGDEAGGGSSGPIRTKYGKPGSVYICHKDGLGQEINVRKSQPLTEWVTVIPTVLAPFKTRPSLGSYLKKVRRVSWRHKKNAPKKLGPAELALPSTPLQMPLDKPRGYRAVMGRTEGECLVGFKWGRQLFPIEFRHVPMRLLDSRNRTVDAVVDVRFLKDGSFTLRSRDGTKLPFRKGLLKNAKGIKDTINQHYNAVRALKEVAGWFGVDVNKVARDARKEEAARRKRAERKR